MKLRYLNCSVGKNEKGNLIIYDIYRDSNKKRASNYLYAYSAYHAFTYDLVTKKSY